MQHTHTHGFNPSKEHPDYQQCEICGSLHRVADVAPFSIYEKGYWNREGFSTIEEQVFNVSGFKNETGSTKIEMILKYASEGEQALELACAPGSLMVALRERYKHVTGIEIDPTYRDQILKVVNGAGALVFGRFPEVSQKWNSESFDFITGMDVLEHIENGPEFMAEILRLLKPDGTVVLMAPFKTDQDPLDANQYVPEHVWIYTESFLKEWFSEMFEEVITDRWISGHNIIVGKGKKQAKEEKPEESPVIETASVATENPHEEVAETIPEAAQEEVQQQVQEVTKKTRKPRQKKEEGVENQQ